MINLLFLLLSLNISNAEQNTLEKNIKKVSKSSSYIHDQDNAKFRVQVYAATAKDLLSSLNANPSKICDRLDGRKGLDFSTSSNYVVSALKKADVIEKSDKDYGLISANFIWESYLTYRRFVDVSHSFENFSSEKLFNSIPEGSIIQVKEGCVKNGAVAIKCKKGLYTTRFPNLSNLKSKLDDFENPNCKISNNLKIIVEADRLIGDFSKPKRSLSSK